MQPAVYTVANQPNGTIYVGVTSNLARRIWQHKNHEVTGFTDRYDVDQLVWHELHDTMRLAIARERQLKHWNRAWKVRLIEEMNPAWNDLYESLI